MHQPNVRQFGLKAAAVMIVVCNIFGFSGTVAWKPFVKSQIAKACPKLGEGVLTQDDQGMTRTTRYVVTKIIKYPGSITEVLGNDGKSVESKVASEMKAVEYNLSFNHPSYWNRTTRINETIKGETSDSYPVCTPK